MNGLSQGRLGLQGDHRHALYGTDPALRTVEQNDMRSNISLELNVGKIDSYAPPIVFIDGDKNSDGLGRRVAHSDPQSVTTDPP